MWYMGMGSGTQPPCGLWAWGPAPCSLWAWGPASKRSVGMGSSLHRGTVGMGSSLHRGTVGMGSSLHADCGHGVQYPWSVVMGSGAQHPCRLWAWGPVSMRSVSMGSILHPNSTFLHSVSFASIMFKEKIVFVVGGEPGGGRCQLFSRITSLRRHHWLTARWCWFSKSKCTLKLCCHVFSVVEAPGQKPRILTAPG